MLAPASLIDIFASRYPYSICFDDVAEDAIEQLFLSLCDILERDVFPSLESTLEILKYRELNNVLYFSHTHVCENIGVSSLIGLVSINNYDTQSLGKYVTDSLKSSDLRINARLSLFESVIQFFLDKPGNKPRFEMSLTSSINSALLDAALPIVFKDGLFVVNNDLRVPSDIDDPLMYMLAKPGLEEVRSLLERATSNQASKVGNPALFASRALEAVLRMIAERHGENKDRNLSVFRIIDASLEIGFISSFEQLTLKWFFDEIDIAGSRKSPDDLVLDSIPRHSSWGFKFCIISISKLLPFTGKV